MAHIVSVRMGDEGGLFAILISTFVTLGGMIFCKSGGGVWSAMAAIYFFFSSRDADFWRGDRAGK